MSFKQNKKRDTVPRHQLSFDHGLARGQSNKSRKMMIFFVDSHVIVTENAAERRNSSWDK